MSAYSGLCILTSISVKHGYIQVCCSSVNNILFQSLTSQKVFSNGERREKWIHVHTHIYNDKQSLSHKDTNSHSPSTLVLLYIQYSTLLYPIFFIFTPLTHKCMTVKGFPAWSNFIPNSTAELMKPDMFLSEWWSINCILLVFTCFFLN